jgi:glutaredoxin
MLMKVVRKVLGAVLLTLDRLTHPTPLKRDPKSQEKVDQDTRSLTLYHMEACPFCIKTRREISRLGLKIESRDILRNPSDGEELVREGGLDQVPCLKITDGGNVRWLYESSDINEYLRKRFEGSPAV